MKRHNNIEDHLREKMPPMRTEFRNELRAHLLQKAERQLKRSSSFMFFTLLLNHMKRYSFGYLTILVIGAFSISAVLKTPLSAQEVLANALENIENNENSGEIYHQEIAYYSYEDGQLINSNIQEWYTDSWGNSLSFDKDAESKKIISTDLYTIDEFGDIVIYKSDEGEDKITHLLRANFSQEQFDIFKGEKIYCIKSQNLENDEVAKAFLTLAADDLNTHLLSGFIMGGPQESQYLAMNNDADKLQDLQGLAKDPILTKDYINTLIKNEAYDYSNVQENGKDYHLFKMEGGQIWFFIDSETYELNRYEFHFSSDPEVVEQYVVLKNEFLDRSEYPQIFDPSQYQDLVAFPRLPHHAPPQLYEKEDGCYNRQMNKMDDAIINQIPLEVILNWENELRVMSTSYEGETIEATGIPDEIKNEQLPTKAPLTQGFYAGHYAWDLAPEEGEDDSVYLPKDGKVEEIAEEGWNGGYGKYLLISHPSDKEIFTLYAHLDEIYVEQGQTLKKGDVIAKMGTSGRTTGKHLHFEVRIDGKRVDPALLWQQ